MKTIKNSVVDTKKTTKSSMENAGFIQSPKGNMYYFHNQKDLINHTGELVRMHEKMAFSVDAHELHWPLDWQMEHYKKVKVIDGGFVPLSYTRENYTFPKVVKGVKAEILEYPGKWTLSFKNIGSIVYLPEEGGIGYIQGTNKKNAKIIYQAIYEIYEQNCNMVKHHSLLNSIQKF